MSDESISQPKPDFISCDQCGATYAAYRSLICPHPIPRQLPISKQIAKKSLPAKKGAKGLPITVSVSIETAIAVIPKKKRGPKPKPGPRVFIEPYYEQQEWETKRQGWKRWTAFSFWMSLRLQGKGTFAEVGRRLGYSDVDLIERWAKEDEWKMRLEAFRIDRSKAERIALDKKLKRQAEQDFALVAAGKAIIAAEYDKVMAEIEAGGTTGLAFDDLTAAFEKLTKLGRLLIGESTENLTLDTPAVALQKRIHTCAKDIVLFLELDRKRGDSDDQMEENRREYIEAGAAKLQVPEESLSAAVDQLDRIEQSDSVS